MSIKDCVSMGAFVRRAPLSALVALASACATGSTLRSRVGDAHLESPPYYAGAPVTRDAVPRIVHLPVTYQQGATQPSFDPAAGSSTPTGALLAEMNRFLDSLGVTTRGEATADGAEGAAGSRGEVSPCPVDKHSAHRARGTRSARRRAHGHYSATIDGSP